MIIGMKMDIAIRIDTWKNKFKYFIKRGFCCPLFVWEIKNRFILEINVNLKTNSWDFDTI